METVPFPTDEDARIASLRMLDLLDTQEEERFDRITRLTSKIFKVPIAYIALVDTNRQWFKSRVGLDFCETLRDESFCTYTILDEKALIIRDALNDDRFNENPMVKSNPFVRFYAGQPLRGPNAKIVGTLCIMDREPREFSREEIRLLGEMGELVEREMALMEVIETKSRLLETQSELIQSQKYILSEMETASHYIESLLPHNGETIHGIRCDWLFQPSRELGGDCFGFHKLDEDHIAIYVIDVCDHGVGAALLSVTLLHLLRSQGFWRIDFTNPIEVLHGLNRFFNKRNRSNQYFTVWYGVYNRQTNRLTYSNGGHPPAILIPRDPSLPEKRIHVPGIAVGFSQQANFSSSTLQIQPGDTLWLFSDGAYEYKKTDGSRQSIEPWIKDLADFTAAGTDSLEPLHKQLCDLHGDSYFDDDICVIRLRFPTNPT